MLGGAVRLGRARPARRRADGPFFNALKVQTTPTYDGSGQTVHPDVFDAGEGNTVHGYRYWMAHTPYPGGNDDFENPSILASNDGETWELPLGAADPLQAFPGGSTHYADADLVVEPDGTMHMTYLYVNGATTEVRLLTSTDGWDTFTGPTTILTDTVVGYLSQTVVRVAANDWRMWVGDYKTNPNRLLYLEAAAIGGPWGPTPRVCRVDGVPPGKDLWHYDVRPDPLGDGWHGLFFCSTRDASGAGSEGYLARSSDGINWNMGRLVLPIGDSGRFDATYSYRGALIPDADPEGDYRIWYSGSNAGVHRVGYTEIPRRVSPQPPAVPDMAAFLTAAAAQSPIYVLPLDDAATGTPSSPTGTNTATADVGANGEYVATPFRGALGMGTDGVNDRCEFTPSGLGLAQPQTWEIWAYNQDPMTAASTAFELIGALNPVTRAPFVFGAFSGVWGNESMSIANHQDGGGITAFSDVVVPPGIHHHAITYSGVADGWTYYLDGVATGTKLAPYNGGAQGFVDIEYAIGAYYDTFQFWPDIAGLVIFASELTAGQIAAHVAAAWA